MFADRFWPMLETGNLQPIIDSVFKIEDADSAHDYVNKNKNTGKVILEVAAPIQSGMYPE